MLILKTFCPVIHFYTDGLIARTPPHPPCKSTATVFDDKALPPGSSYYPGEGQGKHSLRAGTAAAAIRGRGRDVHAVVRVSVCVSV